MTDRKPYVPFIDRLTLRTKWVLFTIGCILFVVAAGVAVVAVFVFCPNPLGGAQ